MESSGGPVAGATDIVAIIVVAIFWLALFCWLTVVGWAKQRRKEREAFYRHETEKKLVDTGGASVDQLLKLRYDEDCKRWALRREGLKLGGLITAAAGLGLVLAPPLLKTGKLSISALGWIPLGIGVALLLYAYLLYPQFSGELGGMPPTPSDANERNEAH